MSAADFAVNFFIALFALIDPIGMAPIFAAAVVGASAAGRRMVAVYIAAFAFVFLAFFYFTGVGLLAFFGISLAAFRIAGGILLFLLGVEMARDDFTARFTEAADGEAEGPFAYARRRFEGLVVPFGMPLLVGPGAISTVVIYGSESRPLGWLGMAAGVSVIASVSLLVLLAFLAAPLISRLLGRIGLTIVVRVLGLILCALAVQFILIGVGEATHGVVRPEAAKPYAGAAS